MPRHFEVQIFPYSANQIYTLVGDIERYPEFLPWCTALRVRRRDGNKITADMSIGFKLVRETFTTEVTLNPETLEIHVTYINGPFRYLTNHWKFRPAGDQLADEGACEVTFDIDFEFRSKLLQTLIGAVFHEVISRMVKAFQERAKQLYGSSLL